MPTTLTNAAGLAAPSLNATNAPGGPVVWTLTDSDLNELLAAVASSERVVIDLETTGLAEHATTGGKLNGGVAARVVLAAMTLPQCAPGTDEWDGAEPTTYLLPLSHPGGPWMGRWRAVLRQVANEIKEGCKAVENQNMKFDSRWIEATTGVDLSELISWDTRISAHLLNENESTKLKEVAPRTFDIDPWDDVDFTTPGAAERTDLWHLGEYAARDTYWTWRLCRHHQRLLYVDRQDGAEAITEDEIENSRLGTLASWCAMPMVRSLTRIEQNGIRVDVPWVKEHLAEALRLSESGLDAMAERYDMDRASASSAATSGWFKEFTSRAVEEGDLMVAAMTPSGNPQWNKSVLRRQARQGLEVAQLILDQRDAQKQAQFLSSWLESTTEDGFVFATYNPGRVVTGRLSSSNPNMQQVAKGLRPAFIPRDGYYMADLDYSQIELRVAAFVAHEKAMTEAFQAGQDLHRLFAARIASKLPEDVEPDERQKAKAGNFGLLYGMGAAGFREYAEDSYGVEMSLDEAVRVHELFFEMWPDLRKWHGRSVARVQQTGQVVSPLGRVRRLPTIWDSSEKMRSFAERAAINSPVQGMASDLMQMAAASIQGLLPGTTPVPRVRLVATVHDSIVAEVPIDGWQEYVAEMKDRMVDLHVVLSKMGVDLNVPLKASASVGTRWGWSDVLDE